jgi:hypothetical protein
MTAKYLCASTFKDLFGNKMNMLAEMLMTSLDKS